MMIDFSDCREVLSPAVKACEKAAAERKNLLLTAGPGAGATMVARRIPTILPPMSDHERRWVAATFEGARMPAPKERPLRAPHHTVSAQALVSEVRLARCGVLYLDELPEFRLNAITELAQTLAKMAHAPLVVASAMPCLCGWLGSADFKTCECSEASRDRHRAHVRKLARPLKLELSEVIPSISLQDLRDSERGESSEAIRSRVTEARGVCNV